MKSRTCTWMIALYLFAALTMSVGLAAQDNPSQNKPKHKKYRLFDVGTFGGPTSYTGVNGPGNRLVSNSGIFIGSADTSAPDPNSPNCYDPDCYVAHAFRWRNGVKTDLGLLPGGYSSAAGGINDSGLIVGQSQNGSFDPLLNFPATRAVLWTSSGMTDLGTLGGYESLAVYVNNGGQVIGLATNSIPDPYSLFGWGAQIHTFLWENGVKQDLGTLGGPDAVPGAGCSNQRRGLVVGQAYTNYIPNPTTGIPTLDPFLWKDGTMLDLGTLGGTIGFAQCANNGGQVIGESNLAGDSASHPFIWDRGVLTDLGTLGGDNGQAIWVNDAGDVVGEADLAGSQVHDAFLWRKGVMTDLGNLGVTSFPYGINSRGQVVGASRIDGTPGNARAFLWEDGGPLVDLNTLIPPNSSLTLVFAEAISERGEIGGTGVPAGCQPADVDVCGHAFLLVPDGDCDGDCQQRVDDGQAEAERRRQTAPAIMQRAELPLTPVERFRSMMRQRYHLPDQLAAPSD